MKRTTARAASFGPYTLDLRSAEQHYPLAQGESLHSAEKGPDGARGMAISQPTRGSMAEGPVPAKYKNESEMKTHGEYCAADAIVLGRLLDSTPVLTSTKALVLTYSHFKVDEVIKSDGIARVESTVVVIRSGGEIVDAGETLRVDKPMSPPYMLGQQYILDLKHDAQTNVPQYFANEENTVLVKSGRIRPSYSAFAGLLPGTAYTDWLVQMEKVSKLACP